MTHCMRFHYESPLFPSFPPSSRRLHPLHVSHCFLPAMMSRHRAGCRAPDERARPGVSLSLLLKAINPFKWSSGG